MNVVVYYSNTDQSKLIAEYLAQQTGFPLFDIFTLTEYEFDTSILVFPIHCQNMPKPIKSFLEQLRTNALIPIATYGKMCYGNVLYEIKKRYKHNIIAAAYVPTKHSYLDENGFANFESLSPILYKINNPDTITIGKSYKNPLANIFPAWRSRIGIKMSKDENCIDCGVCTNVCTQNAIINGKTNGKCIRCLKCVNACPNNALHYKVRSFLRKYLRKKKCDKLIIYV